MNNFPTPLQEFLQRLKQQGKAPVVLMWGLGCDTAKILLDWLSDPTTKYFELDQLLVIVSMTLGEWSKTGYLNEMHILPLLAANQVLTMQIVKAGPRKAQGYTILDCSTTPRKLWLYGWATPPLSPMSEDIAFDPTPIASPLHPLWTPDGLWLQPSAWRINHPGGIEASYAEFPNDLPHQYITHNQASYGLADECLQGGTIPQFSGSRTCSTKFKGQNNDQLVAELGSCLGLGELMLTNGSIPQYNGKVRSCSDRAKQEGLNESIITFFKDGVGSTYGLGDDLLLSGAVPQVAKGKGRGKCSDKAKAVPCDSVVDDLASPLSQDYHWQAVQQISKNKWRKLLFHKTDPALPVPLPPFIQIVIGFNADEEARIKRGEQAERSRAIEDSNRQQPIRPAVYRILRYPLHERGIDRAMLEQSLLEVFGETFWRSACSFCPFGAINGGSKEFITKHSHLSGESGYALLIEFISRRLNSKQVLTPSGSLYDLIKQHGIDAALDNLQARVKALPWAVYRVQRIYDGLPKRRTQILVIGSYAEIDQLFLEQAQILGAEVTIEPDGIARAFIENNGITVDFIVACPKVPVEKHRAGWQKAWDAYHQKQLILKLLST